MIRRRPPNGGGPKFAKDGDKAKAESVLGTQIYRWFNFPIERPDLPALRGWYDRMRQRPGFKTHIETPIT